jgi:hypothetical protein
LLLRGYSSRFSRPFPQWHVFAIGIERALAVAVERPQHFDPRMA